MRMQKRKISLQPLKRHRPLSLNRRRHPHLHRRIHLLPHPRRCLPRQRRNRRNNLRLRLRLRPNLRPRLSLPPAGTSTPSRRLCAYARFNCTVRYDAASDEYIVVVLYG